MLILKALTGAGLTAAAICSFPSAVAAPYGGCHVDSYGRCSYMTPDQVAPEDSPAEMAAFGSTPDQHFAYFVTHDEDAPWFVIMDFDLVKSQGLRSCQQRANSTDILAAISDLQRAGGYTEEQASNIVTSAGAVYCPWVKN